MVEEPYRRLALLAGCTWHVDEIHFKSEGSPMWPFSVMDAETSQIIAYDTVPENIGYAATGLLRVAVRHAGKRPDVPITDALNRFWKGHGRVMYTNTTHWMCHMAGAGICGRRAADNLYGRLNGEIRDRIARVRRFCSKMAVPIRLLIAYHNLVRTHVGLGGATPAGAAGLAMTDQTSGCVDTTRSTIPKR